MKEWIKMRSNNRVCPVINDNLVDEKNRIFSEVFTISESLETSRVGPDKFAME